MNTDREYASIPEAGTLAFLFHRQWLHVLGLVLLVPICGAFAAPALGEGAFAWTSNAMYALVFLGLWGSVLLTGSLAALAAALFQHAYIWLHYYCTEAPDMALIYGGAGNSGSDENRT
jgi:hypothetical protein